LPSELACNPTAIEPGKRGGQTTTAEQLLSVVQEIDELPNGFAFRLPNDTPVLQTAAEFITNERLCCPFFGFALEIEPQGGAVWLRVTGEAGVKDLMRAQFSIG